MGANFCPDPVKVEVVSDYVLQVSFSDGKVTQRDMSELLKFPAFRKLKNKAFFALVRIGAGGCLTWPGDIDIAPEDFYYADD